MKKRVLLISVLTGVFIFSGLMVNAQTAVSNSNLRTFSQIMKKRSAGNVDIYRMNLVKGQLYGFTIGATGFKSGQERVGYLTEWGCDSFRGNDISILFLFPKRYFLIDARQFEGAETVVFTAAANESVSVVVQPDASRCEQYQIQLITSDRAISGIQNPLTIPKRQVIGGLELEKPTQVSPPELDQTARNLFSPIMREYQTLEKWRSQVKNMNPSYRKASDWMESYQNNEINFWYQAHQADFKLLDPNSNKQNTFKQVETALANFSKGFTAPEGQLFAYFRLLEINQTIQSFKESINSSIGNSGKSQELNRELDALQTFYNQTAPNTIAGIDAAVPKDGGLKESTIIYEKIGPLYNQIYHRLNGIKKKGDQAGVSWKCRFFQSENRVPLPFCEF